MPDHIEVFTWGCSRESNIGAAVRTKFTLLLAVEFCSFLAPLSTNVCLGSFTSACWRFELYSLCFVLPWCFVVQVLSLCLNEASPSSSGCDPQLEELILAAGAVV